MAASMIRKDFQRDIDALNSKITTAKLTLGASVTANGNFLLEFDATKAGYRPLSIISWNLQDRGQGGKIFITGFLINGNTAQVYGFANASITFNTQMSIDVLYIAI